jgi:cell division transport system ATP-binding protein
VAIARALVHDPMVIIGDEPTGNLDPVTSKEIIDIFLDLHKEGKTIIIATHDQNIVNALKKRVIVFKDKQVVSDEKKGEYKCM